MTEKYGRREFFRKGAGLGLSTAFGSVRDAGGRMSAESRPGAGTTFRVELPLMGSAEPGAAPGS